MCQKKLSQWTSYQISLIQYFVRRFSCEKKVEIILNIKIDFRYFFEMLSFNLPVRWNRYKASEQLVWRSGTSSWRSSVNAARPWIASLRRNCGVWRVTTATWRKNSRWRLQQRINKQRKNSRWCPQQSIDMQNISIVPMESVDLC